VGRRRPDRLDRHRANTGEAGASQGESEAAVSYWSPSQDTCSAECAVQWYTDDETRKTVWDKFANGPEPVGYDPFIIPMWSDGPTSEQFAVLRLAPYRLRVMPAAVLTRGEGQPLAWSAPLAAS